MGTFAKPSSRIPRRQHGFTMVELLVIVAILGILLGLLIPAVLTARAAARRSQCQGNMRSMGQALLAFESAKRRLPAGRDQFDFREHSWATHVLPYIEQQDVYDRYDFNKRWRDMDSGLWEFPWDRAYIDGSQQVGGNLEVAATNIPTFICPATNHDYNGAIDYGGNYGTSSTGQDLGFRSGEAWDSGLLVGVNLAFMPDSRRRGIRLAQVTDGISHTAMVFEDAGREPQQGGMWANGHNCFGAELVSINLERSNEIYSDHGGIAYALLADGSVMTLTGQTERDVIAAISTRAGGEARVELIQ